MEEIINEINTSWKWLNIEAVRIILINKFGNIIFENNDNSIWRICPEELYCVKTTNSIAQFSILKHENEFIEDWEMINFVKIAERKFGVQQVDRVFCLKFPAVLGGEYALENFGTITLRELIRFSGDLAFQIKDLKDGQKVKLKTINGK